MFLSLPHAKSNWYRFRIFRFRRAGFKQAMATNHVFCFPCPMRANNAFAYCAPAMRVFCMTIFLHGKSNPPL